LAGGWMHGWMGVKAVLRDCLAQSKNHLPDFVFTICEQCVKKPTILLTLSEMKKIYN
jgi:hypothetical protein